MSQTTKILWGPTTWTFFHVLAEKMNEDFFIKNKNEVISIIINISSNLPCPLCSEHAKKVLGVNNTRLIKTKIDLINFLHFFHNTVNTRNKKELFKSEDLVKYKNISLNIAFHNFKIFYTKSYNKSSFQLSLDSMQTTRKRIAYLTTKWIQKNWKHFN